jgi:hypothetical protein
LGNNQAFRLSKIVTGTILGALLLLTTGSGEYIRPHSIPEADASVSIFHASGVDPLPAEQPLILDLSKGDPEPSITDQLPSEAALEESAVKTVEETVIDPVVPATEPVLAERDYQSPVKPITAVSQPAPAPPATKPVESPVGSTIPAPVTVQPPAPVYDRSIYVGSAGGQETVDKCIGPVLFHLPDPNFPVYVAEHDGCGGWERIGTLGKGQSVHMSGLVSGDYTVQEITTVKKKSNSNQIRFSKKHSVVLQTCIPQTDWMIVVGMD